MCSDIFNGSGCKDLTAYKAIKQVSKEQKREKRNSNKDIGKLVQTIKSIIDIAGYELVDRIVVMDKETKKIYR